MIYKGSMIEALSYANEAYILRLQLLQMNFSYSTKQQDDIIGDNGEIIKNSGYTFKNFDMQPSAATRAWSKNNGFDNFDFILTPWNVLRCYLESLLQLGTLQEIVGDGARAATTLVWGKKISSFQDLPIFLVSFSTVLGKIYCKQQRWDLAEKELNSAKDILLKSSSLMSCLKCKLILEVKVDLQLYDLFRNRSDKPEGLSEAENFYRSAVEKLKLSEWKNCVSNPKETISRNTVFCDTVLIGGNDVFISSDCGNHEEREASQPKVGRKGGNAQNEFKGTQKSLSDCIVFCGCEDTCVFDEVKCWHCVLLGVIKSSSLLSVTHMKWECTRRRLLVKLLTERGKSLWAQGETQRAHEVFLDSISVLVNRSTFHPSEFKISFNLLSKLTEKNIIGDMFTVEHATLLYTICWLSLRSTCNDGRRNYSGCMFQIPIPTVVSGLKLSLIGCREVPELFQKVSRLLAVLYTLSLSSETFSMLDSSSDSLSVSQWASYFHQASIGTHVYCQLLFRDGLQEDQNTMHIDLQGSFPSSSTSLSLHRLASKSEQDLEAFILNFFQGLPRATIICISILGDDYASWLSSLFPCKSTRPWIMFSRLNSDCAPIVIALPIVSILAGSTDEKKTSSDKQWYCPWGHTVVDQIAPLFRTILEEWYMASQLTDPIKWKMQIPPLEGHLRRLLRNVEVEWFGPWKDLLLGGLSDHKQLDLLERKLTEDLKSQCQFDVHENVIKAVIRGGGQRVECLSELVMRKGCYIGGRECANDGSLSSTLSDLLSNTMQKIGNGDYVDREPIILVPDLDIQMLPWESLPILRDQEVYCMPSVASIAYTCDRSCRFEEPFPMIDPLDAYYFLNTSGGKLEMIKNAATWFRRQIREGTVGTLPSVDVLNRALKDHDLFIYAGHASDGVQYIHDEIQKLERCAAGLLMGCSTGSLSLNGPYIPLGVPLSCVFAGSPVVIVNLWDVTEDIIHFAIALLGEWMKARDCAQCIQDNLNDMSITAKKGKKKPSTSKYARKGKKKLSTSKFVEAPSCKHRPMIGQFMSQARKVCRLPFLDGAAPVCYGVPTGIYGKAL